MALGLQHSGNGSTGGGSRCGCTVRLSKVSRSVSTPQPAPPSPNGAPDWKPSAGGSVGLEVDDFDAAINRLRTTGCTFRLEPMETPVCHMAVVFDPDGNSLMIHRRKADLIGFKRSCEEQAESYDGQGQSGGDRTRSLYDFYLCAAVQPPVQSRLALMHGSIFIGDGELALRDLAYFEDPDGMRLEIVARTSTRRALETRWEELDEFVNPLQALTKKEQSRA